VRRWAGIGGGVAKGAMQGLETHMSGEPGREGRCCRPALGGAIGVKRMVVDEARRRHRPAGLHWKVAARLSATLCGDPIEHGHIRDIESSGQSLRRAVGLRYPDLRVPDLILSPDRSDG
jgi:hypothetical protein